MVGVSQEGDDQADARIRAVAEERGGLVVLNDGVGRHAQFKGDQRNQLNCVLLEYLRNKQGEYVCLLR